MFKRSEEEHMMVKHTTHGIRSKQNHYSKHKNKKSTFFIKNSMNTTKKKQLGSGRKNINRINILAWGPVCLANMPLICQIQGVER